MAEPHSATLQVTPLNALHRALGATVGERIGTLRARLVRQLDDAPAPEPT